MKVIIMILNQMLIYWYDGVDFYRRVSVHECGIQVNDKTLLLCIFSILYFEMRD